MKKWHELDNLLKQFTAMEGGPAGCALAVTRGGQEVYTGYCGMADIENNRPIDANTIYRLYSSSKVVTATAMLQLLEQGLYQLDDQMAAYLPEFADAVYCQYTGNNVESLVPVRSLTVKHFITMTSGLTYDGGSNTTQRSIRAAMRELDSLGGYTVRDFSRRMARVPLAFEPGTHWNYAINMDILGAFIEVVSGQSFYEYLKSHIFDPLGMEHTYFFVPEPEKTHAAVVYQSDPERGLLPNRAEDYKFEPGYRFECGGGGLQATLGDMSRFIQALAMGGTLDGVKILSRKGVDLMRLNHLAPGPLADFQAAHRNGWPFMSGYGYGLGVKTLIDQAASNCLGTLGEFSWAGATGTLLLADPSERLSIAYMHQLMPNNKEGVCHPRLKNTIYSLID
jgi:CubicO group peptidase (beta-lactamase class C family)